jgi:phosphonate transport system substrate-binding protein
MPILKALTLSLHLTLMTALFFPIEVFAQDPEKLIFAFQKQKQPDELKAAAEKMALVLAKEIGKTVEILIPTSYSTSVQGLISGKVHVAYMDSLPFVLARKETKVEIIAVEKRNGRTDYDSLIVVKKGSPIAKLADLKGKKMAFTSQTSTSGYLMPFSRLVHEKQLSEPQELEKYFTQILYAGGYDKALQAVTKGQTDAAAFSDYVIEGKKADLYGTQTEREQIQVLARTPGVPTHLIALKSDLSLALKKKIQAALLKVTKENPELLSSVYGAAELIVPANPEAHVARTLQALKDTGLDVKAFVK